MPTPSIRLKRWRRVAGICALCGGVAAPGVARPDYRPALRALQAQDARIATIAWRLTTANVALCRPVSAQTGLLLADAAQYLPSLRQDATAAFGLSGPVTIAAVVSGSAAAHAGLAVGDSVEAVDDTPLSAEPPGPRPSHAALDRAAEAIAHAAARGPVALDVRRGQRRVTIRFVPDPGCASTVQLVPERRRNADADGRTVTITTALAAATQDDDELAIVIAHELAHNMLHHRDRLDQEQVSRGAFAGLGRSGAALRETEAEADRVGLYLAARAGYDPAAGARFWARFGRQTDPIVGDGTHPGWRRRATALAATAAEIAAKRAAGAPLIPDRPPLPIP